MSIPYTQELYNEIQDTKKYNESLIQEMYSNYSNYTFEQQLDSLEIIDGLKEINTEFEKYIIVYNSIVKNQNITSEYIVIEGDTLQKIAQKMTGNYENWTLIYDENNLTDIQLTPGDTLVIPNV